MFVRLGFYLFKRLILISTFNRTAKTKRGINKDQIAIQIYNTWKQHEGRKEKVYQEQINGKVPEVAGDKLSQVYS